MHKICIMPLIGLPGAGKTTISEILLRRTSNLNVIHICYDSIISFNNYTTTNHKRTDYKEKRCYIVNQLLVKIIETIRSNGKLDELNLRIKINFNDVPYLIMCDDNHYYRSMRYEIYQLAKLYGLSYIQLYIECTVKLALIRNAKRFNDNKVPDEVIYNMAGKFESPTSLAWEQNTIIINSEKEFDGNDTVHKILTRIMKAFETPLNKQLNIVKPSQEQNQSAIHKLDLLLRKRIKDIIESSTNSSKDKKQKADLLNRRRKEVIAIFSKKNMQNVNDLEYFVQLLESTY